MNWYSIISLTSEVYRLGDNQVSKDRDTRSAIVGEEGRTRAPRAHALKLELTWSIYLEDVDRYSTVLDTQTQLPNLSDCMLQVL